MKEKYIEDLREIREIMNRSTRFISLSGLSGIAVGIAALTGSYLAYRHIFINGNYLTFEKITIEEGQLSTLIITALGTMLISIFLVFYLTVYEAGKRKQKLWNEQLRKILVDLFIPLITGGIISLIFLNKGFIGPVLAITLIFYGLALLNVSRYTLKEIRSLGMLEVILGMFALQFISYSLILWSFGFGVLHILYGIVVKLKYK